MVLSLLTALKGCVRLNVRRMRGLCLACLAGREWRREKRAGCQQMTSHTLLSLPSSLRRRS